MSQNNVCVCACAYTHMYRGREREREEERDREHPSLDTRHPVNACSLVLQGHWEQPPLD